MRNYPHTSKRQDDMPCFDTRYAQLDQARDQCDKLAFRCQDAPFDRYRSCLASCPSLGIAYESQDKPDREA